MKHILVTGGTGFIGSHTCLSLLKNGYKVVIFDNLTNSSYDSFLRIKKIAKNFKLNVIDNIDFINGDIRDEKLLNQIFAKYNSKNQSISFFPIFTQKCFVKFK